MNPPQSNPTAQLIMLQNRAHHEDRILHSRHVIDNRLNDFSHVLNPIVPSKKKYLSKERSKDIYNANLSLLSKIYAITFDKNGAEITSKLSSIPKPPKREESTIDLHPCSTDNRARSLNIGMRRREIKKINKDNSQLLERLRTMKPTVPQVPERNQRTRELDSLKKLLNKRDNNQSSRILQPYIQYKSKGESVLSRYIQRHDLIQSRENLSTQNDTTFISKEPYVSSSYIDARMNTRPDEFRSGNILDELKPLNAVTTSANLKSRESSSHLSNSIALQTRQSSKTSVKRRSLRPLPTTSKTIDYQNLSAKAKLDKFNYKDMILKEMDSMEKIADIKQSESSKNNKKEVKEGNNYEDGKEVKDLEDSYLAETPRDH